jgi:hypothetical protein
VEIAGEFNLRVISGGRARGPHLRRLSRRSPRTVEVALAWIPVFSSRSVSRCGMKKSAHAPVLPTISTTLRYGMDALNWNDQYTTAGAECKG